MRSYQHLEYYRGVHIYMIRDGKTWRAEWKMPDEQDLDAASITRDTYSQTYMAAMASIDRGLGIETIWEEQR